jgi:hypothetical protein
LAWLKLASLRRDFRAAERPSIPFPSSPKSV